MHAGVGGGFADGDLPWIDYVFAEDREVRGAASGTRQRSMGFDNGSMTHAGTYEFITRLPRDVEQLGKGTEFDPRTLGNVTGGISIESGETS